VQNPAVLDTPSGELWNSNAFSTSTGSADKEKKKPTTKRITHLASLQYTASKKDINVIAKAYV